MGRQSEFLASSKAQKHLFLGSRNNDLAPSWTQAVANCQSEWFLGSRFREEYLLSSPNQFTQFQAQCSCDTISDFYPNADFAQLN
jgi:hypothetical protein